MTSRCISLGCAVAVVFAAVALAQSPQPPQRALTVRGRVFAAATNATVAESHVLIVERTSRGRVVRTVRTDAAGNYEATSVLPGSYLVARARGYGTKYTTISSQGGNSITVPFPLEEAASLSGRVADAFGAPVAGATVRVAYSGDVSPFLIAADLGETQTNTNGEFTLSHVNPGQPFVVEALTPVHPVTYSLPLILGPTQKHTNLDLVLKTGGQLSLLVEDAATQRPLANARVLIRHTAEHPQVENSVGYLQTMHRSAATAADGTLALSGLAPGEHTVSVVMPGYVQEQRRIRVLDSVPTMFEIQLRSR
jgi:hypothetical protein